MPPQETGAASLPSVDGEVTIPPMPKSLVNGAEARHAMLRGTGEAAVTTAACQCHSACIHFAISPVLVTCAQATLQEESFTEDAQVTGHFNANAQDAHACVDEGSGGNRSFILLQFMDGERIAMFAIRFHKNLMTWSELLPRPKLIQTRWKNICSIMSKQVSGDNRQHPSPHLPIFIHSCEDAPRWRKLWHHQMWQELWQQWPRQRQLLRQRKKLWRK